MGNDMDGYFKAMRSQRDVGRIADFVGLKNVDPSRARAFIQPDLNHFAQKVRAVS